LCVEIATYGLAVLTDNSAAARLAPFLLSEKGQAIIAENGLVPASGNVP
jgi:molybdate transport system substrate-binding protein